MKEFVFAEPLREGVILSRNGSMALRAELAGASVSCHYPVRGRLSGISIEGRPCLLSRNIAPDRRTEYTAEAISLEQPEDPKKRWIGLNRIVARDCVAHYLPRREFSEMLGTGAPAVPGGNLLGMRTDFRLGDTFLKLQVPMGELHLPLPSWVRVQPKETAPFGVRMVRQLKQAAEGIGTKERLIVLLCYLYDSPPEALCGRKDPAFGEVREALTFMRLRGIEIWQANFRMEPKRVWLIRSFPILPENADGTAPAGIA